MARLTGPIPFIGSIGNLSAYTRRDLDQIIIRTKGGATKEQIKKKPSFKNTRLHNKEWEGVTAMSKAIRQSIHNQKHLADYNFTGTLNAIGKKLEKLDSVNELGKRSLLLSNGKYLLEGFSLNKRILFDSILRQPIDCTIDRSNCGVHLIIPAIYPGINFINSSNNPLFRFVMMLGFISDFVFDETYNGYKPITQELPNSVFAYTDWSSVQQKKEAEGIFLQAQNQDPLDEAVTMIVSVGIEFGTLVADGAIEYVKYSGTAKLLKLG